MQHKIDFFIRLLQYCCIFTALLHLCSFIFYLPFAFYSCVLLSFILFGTALSHLSVFQQNHITKSLMHDQPAHFYTTWSITAKYLTIFLLIYAIFNLVFSIHLLGNEQVHRQHSGYVLKQQGTFIREATEQEYQHYQMRITRLFSSYLLLFFVILFNLLRFK